MLLTGGRRLALLQESIKYTGNGEKREDRVCYRNEDNISQADIKTIKIKIMELELTDRNENINDLHGSLAGVTQWVTRETVLLMLSYETKKWNE